MYFHLPPPAHTPTSQWHWIESLTSTTSCLGWPHKVCCNYQDATDQVFMILYFHSIPIRNNQLGLDQESVEARWSDTHSQSKCPEIVCLINLAPRMKNGEGHHMSSQKLRSTSFNKSGSILLKEINILDSTEIMCHHIGHNLWLQAKCMYE